MELIAREAIIIRHEDYYMGLKILAQYSSLSERKLRELISRGENPLPYYRVDGKILIKRSAFDRWVEEETKRKSQALDSIVNEVIQGLSHKKQKDDGKINYPRMG